MALGSLKASPPAWKGSRPQNIGILAMEIYFPAMYVAQQELEVHDGVSAGKYTRGLGQNSMAVCSNVEDINSACLNAVSNLLEKYQISPSLIGRMEVGTESLVDKSKAVKTVLMDLFANHGNTDIEGIDSKNACYGGTAAFFNSLAWIESSAWDGRFAIVVAGDIAVYDKGPARPTGGAGVVAMLVGPDAPLVVEPVRTTYMQNVWDFYKPNMISEYPVVDGHLSNKCYLQALDTCYSNFAERWSAWKAQLWTLEAAQYSIFHAPYNKLVQKSFGRLLFHDYRMHKSPQLADLKPYTNVDLNSTYTEWRNAEIAIAEAFTLVYYHSSQTKQILCLDHEFFSSLMVTRDVQYIRDTADVITRLYSRTKIEPQHFENILEQREKEHTRTKFSPSSTGQTLFPGSYFLNRVDEVDRRFYQKTRKSHTITDCRTAAHSRFFIFGRAARLITRLVIRKLI
eukprot:gene7632-582_t